MKKRILSLLLALLTVLGSLPLMGAAAPEAELAPELTACPACGTLGCTTEHLWCDICQKYDCGLVCYICTVHGCTTEHKYCEACGKYDCGVDHSFVGPLQLTDAAAAENGAAASPAAECTCGTETETHAETCPLYMAPAPQCTCGTEGETHAETCPLYVAPAPQCTCGTESETHAETCPLWTEPAAQPSLYDMLMATESMADFEAVALACGDSYLELTEAEIIDLNDKIEELYASIEEPTEDDTAKKTELFEMICLCPAAPVCDECGLFNAHTDTCSLKPAQDEGEGEACPDCGFADGLHAVDCASRCSCGQYKPADGTHIGTCELYTCPDCGVLLNQNGFVHDVNCGDEPEAPVTPDYSADIGKYAMIIETEDCIFIADVPDHDATFPYYDTEFEENTVFRIEDVCWDEETTALMYQVSIAYGGPLPDVYWPADPWVLQDYTDESYDFPPALYFVDVSFCPDCGEPNCTKNHDTCPTCGSEGCTMNHFLPCEVCGSTQCSPHIYCNVCNKYDCGLTHKYCGSCNKYDCGLTHENPFAPLTAPIITPPAYSAGDVTISDRYGNVVNSLVLSGLRDTLSAWGPYADYQWQICYDAANDLWADIEGQSAQGIVVSPAMFLGTFTGGASIRCRSGSGDSAVYSAPVAVSFAAPAAETFRGTVGSMLPIADEPATDTLNFVVRYVYSDGRTAASTETAQLPVGGAFNRSYNLPAIPGYVPTLKVHNFGTAVVQQGNSLAVSFPAGALTESYNEVVVEYVPGYVNYTVIHKHQNTYDDYYTEVSRETVGNKYKTGEVITEAHNSYPGFYNLLYETPAAAADGSTVIEVYYDRYYYLMTFDMGTGGYGTDPIYARYGAPIEAENPTRPGYTFKGWSLDGKNIIKKEDFPATMPVGNVKYTAVWEETDLAKVSIVVWGENADDEEYSYLKTMELYVKPGTTFTYSEDRTRICGIEEHIHGANCKYNCGKTEHSHTVENGCYTLDCNLTSHDHATAGCQLSCSHTAHTLDCYKADGGYNRTLVERNKPTQTLTDQGNGIYSYYYNRVTRYVLNIGDDWYENSRGSSYGISLNCTHGHTDRCYSCGLTAGTHVHSVESGCYDLTCTQETHNHSNACGYACGKTAHTHSSSCYMDGAGLESDLWTFVKSDTVKVEANGSTVMNVYFDRTTFTLKFSHNGTIVETINDKWGALIKDYFPIVSENGTSYRGTRWRVPNGCQNFTPGTNVLSIDIMPPENITFTYYNAGDQSALYYYVEALPGGEFTHQYDGRNYNLYKTVYMPSSGKLTQSEEFHDIVGFSQGQYSPNNIFSQKSAKMYLYYTRNRYAIEFYNPTELIRKQEEIPYQTNLGSYNFTPTSDMAPEIYEPGSVKFVGWYLNPECTGEQYILANHTMPAATNNGDTAVALYAKWELVEHKVNYYLDKGALDKDETIPQEMSRLYGTAETIYSTAFAEDTVLHGGLITGLSDPGMTQGYESIHRYAGYTFVGWFYINDEGKETAFDPENIPVDRDLDLYAKWSANKICKYNIYFALDSDENGIADTDDKGNVIYVADPLRGSGIAGHTYTFAAEDELYEAYKEGYFPTVGSHSITIDIADEEGTGANSHTFLYRPTPAVPYKVLYLEKGTGNVLHPEKNVEDNDKIIVTENFVPVNGYMPDAYQKTHVIQYADGLVEENYITFWYTKDAQHSIYVANHYIEELDANLNHKGWVKYNSFQSTGDINQIYTADAISIDGFTLSAYYTNRYNTVDKINGESGAALPTTVSSLNGTVLSGKLGANGMELNFYYTRNIYPYEFRHMLYGTSVQLHDPTVGKGAYGTTVSGASVEIKKDLDGDGYEEEYKLYDPTESVKYININTDGEPLSNDAQVAAGQATINVATFYYVRCTQDLTVTKTVVDNAPDIDPDPDKEYEFKLTINSTAGFHQSAYNYAVDGTPAGVLIPMVSDDKSLSFRLKAGQTITIEALPTAEYTLTELSLPTGFIDPTYTPGRTQTLTVDEKVSFTVTNTFQPAALEVSKTVDEVEESLNLPEVTEFGMTVAFPEGVALEESYLCVISGSGESRTENITADFTNRNMVFTLRANETARFANLPTGAYTVTETNYSALGYKSNVSVNDGTHTESLTATATLANGSTQKVDFLNVFPVGDLIIKKTVTKEFFKTPWNGDSFTFTVERTNEGRPLKVGNKYNIFDGDTLVGTATVSDEKELTVEITFGEADAAALETAGAEVTHSYTIKNLPAGTYSVAEKVETDYHQYAGGTLVTDGSAPSVSGLVLPAETMPTAEFANELIRPTGSLSLEKLLVRAAGYDGNMPENPDFSFTILLTEEAPKSVAVSVTQNGVKTDVNMTDEDGFEITMKANETVVIEGLPIGKYRVIEHSKPSYANAFEVKNSGAWEKQDISAENGNLYTEVEVTVGVDPTEVRCTNIYPVERAQLIVSKDYTKEYDRDKLPEGLSSNFEICFAEYDCSEYYYTVFENGNVAKDENGNELYNVTAAVTEKVVSGTDRDYCITITLKDGQYAVITGGLSETDANGDGRVDTVEGTPVCGYTVTETNADLTHFNVSYELFQSELENQVAADADENAALASADAVSYTGKFLAGKLDKVVFTNQYKRHLGTITIIKDADSVTADDSFIFHINGINGNDVDMDVALDGPGSVTIYDVPIGEYKVTEDLDWSWRYTAPASNYSVTIALDNPETPHNELEQTVNYSNTLINNKWLNAANKLLNSFSSAAGNS